MQYTVFLKQRDGGYTATIPWLPDCLAQGRTRDEALQNIQVSLRETLANLDMETIEIDLPTSPNGPRNPWLETAGMFKDDPLFEEMLAEVEVYRREVEEMAP